MSISGEKDQNKIIAAVYGWFEQNERWLLIFDNVEKSQDVGDFLPSRTAGHVLITTRYPKWRRIASSSELNEWERRESIDFILKSTDQEDTETAVGLADALGDLPLALEQAVAYIDEYSISLSDYLKQFKSERSKLWSEEEPPIDYPATVATTFRIAIDRVKETAPSGVAILNLCAYFAPDAIPRFLFSKMQNDLPDFLSLKPDDVNQGIKALKQHSLIKADPNNLSVHRLVQAVTRDRLSEDEKKKWIEIGIQIAYQIFPVESGNVQYWSLCDSLIHHVLESTMYADQYHVALDNVSHLLRRIGSYLWAKGNHTQAESHLRRALNIIEKQMKPDDSFFPVILNELANVLRDQGKYAESESYYRKAVEIDEKIWGHESLEVAVVLNNLAGAVRDQGRYTEAESIIRKSLRIREQKRGMEHPEVAACLSNLSALLKAQGKYKEAESFSRQSLDIVEKHLNPEHPNVGLNLNSLAELLVLQGIYTEAEQLFRRALRILVKSYNSDHPKTKKTRRNLESLLKKMKSLNLKGKK